MVNIGCWDRPTHIHTHTRSFWIRFHSYEGMISSLFWLPRIAKFLRYHRSVYIVHRRLREMFWASSGQEFTKRCRFTFPALFCTYLAKRVPTFDFLRSQKVQRNRVFIHHKKKGIAVSFPRDYLGVYELWLINRKSQLKRVIKMMLVLEN